MYRTLVNIKEEILQNKELNHFNLKFLNQLEDTRKISLIMRGGSEYIKIINKEQFREPSCPKIEWRQLIVLAAARLGNTRLIDNTKLFNWNIQ